MKRRRRRDGGCSAAVVPRLGKVFGGGTRHRACSLAPGAFFSGVVIRRVFGSAMRRDRPKQPARLMYSQNKSSCSRNKDVYPGVRTAHSAQSFFLFFVEVGISYLVLKKIKVNKQNEIRIMEKGKEEKSF